MLSLACFQNHSTEENQHKEQYFFSSFISCITTKAGYDLFCEGRKLVALLRQQRICVEFVTIPIQRGAHLLDEHHLMYCIHT